VDVSIIQGLGLAYEQGRFHMARSVASLARTALAAPANLSAFEAVRRFAPELAISDFETLTWAYAHWARIPLLGLDNLGALHRCRPEEPMHLQPNFLLARAATKAKLMGCWHYLVSSFSYPEVRKPRTTLIPPILRPEILAARREPGDQILVYQSVWSKALVEALHTLPETFIAYGADRDDVDGNIQFQRFDGQGFVEHLRTARAVIAGGGFSLMTECLHLGVPMLAVPLDGHVEQEINARHLAEQGYGHQSGRLDIDTLEAFLADLPQLDAQLANYPRQDNTVALDAVDELVERAMMGESAPYVLHSEGMGDFALQAQ